MVFNGLSIHIARFHSQSRPWETKIFVQELWLKMGGGLIRERGVFVDMVLKIKSELSGMFISEVITVQMKHYRAKASAHMH